MAQITPSTPNKLRKKNPNAKSDLHSRGFQQLEDTSDVVLTRVVSGTEACESEDTLSKRRESGMSFLDIRMVGDTGGRSSLSTDGDHSNTTPRMSAEKPIHGSPSKSHDRSKDHDDIKLGGRRSSEQRTAQREHSTPSSQRDREGRGKRASISSAFQDDITVPRPANHRTHSESHSEQPSKLRRPLPPTPQPAPEDGPPSHRRQIQRTSSTPAPLRPLSVSSVSTFSTGISDLELLQPSISSNGHHHHQNPSQSRTMVYAQMPEAATLESVLEDPHGQYRGSFYQSSRQPRSPRHEVPREPSYCDSFYGGPTRDLHYEPSQNPSYAHVSGQHSDNRPFESPRFVANSRYREDISEYADSVISSKV
ncbi:hypothetical protein BXZ70DRAFT_344119 [Cristinia sonorae]|uniref:Uncharacterized protein n=1 Tax=Cristinia sonorae TaxID=1940300 RepID=A0A8K0UL10_9AGAR|nr:hypothetical protein BXZ70DRAFT_344119 [Cristinia sonorae]